MMKGKKKNNYLSLKDSLKISKYNLKLRIPQDLWFFVFRISGKRLWDKWFYSERRRGRGYALRPSSSPKEKVFLIRRKPPGAGFFSNAIFVLDGLLRAEALSRIPIVDFKNYKMMEMYDEAIMDSDSNVWEFYFKQVSELNLSHLESYDVLLSSGIRPTGDRSWLISKSPTWIFDDSKIKIVNSLIKTYLRLSNYSHTELNSYKKQICWNGNEVLAVAYRGGNYTSQKYDGHARQPNVQTFLSRVDKALSNSGATKIFPLTQDYEFYQLTKQRYGEMVLEPCTKSGFESIQDFREFGPREIRGHWDKGATFLSFDQSIRYLIDVMLVAESNYLLAAPTNAVAFAIAANGLKFEQIDLIDEGVY